jgi:hypothetical protein
MEEKILESIYGSYVLLGTLIREAVDKEGYKTAVGYGSRTSEGPDGTRRQIKKVGPKTKSGKIEPSRKMKSGEKQHRPARG